MAKNSKDVYGAQGRSNVLMFDPNNLVIVEDPSHPLFDERCRLPLNESLVLNVMMHGIVETIVFRKNPETGENEVIDGRQRVKAAREANIRLAKQGLETIMVPALPRRGEDAMLAGVMVSTNEIRTEDTPFNRARKMARLMAMGKDEDFLAIQFGVGKQTIKNYLSLLDVTTPVRNAVEGGKLAVSEAYKLSKLDPEEQKTTLSKMLEAGAGEKGSRKRSRKMREAAGTGPKVRGKREIDAYKAKIEDKCGDDDFQALAISILNWVLGGSEPRIPRTQRDPRPVVAVETPTAISA